MSLSDLECKNAKPREKAWKLFDGSGLYLEITPTGSKYWRLKYRHKTKEKRLALGVYPEVSLTEARQKKEDARSLLRKEIDPALDRREKKLLSLQASGDTFEKIAREWHELKKGGWSVRHANDILHRLEMDVFPEIGNIPITDIRPPIILAVIRKIEKRDANEMARRALQYIGRIFRFAVALGKAPYDPTRDLKEVLSSYEKGHFAALETKDIPIFLNAIEFNHARLYPQTIRALKLLILTFVRTSELINAPKTEFNFEKEIWIISGERMKRKRDHIVPLSKQAVAILKTQFEFTGSSPFAFPNIAKPYKNMSNNTILKAIGRLGYFGRMTGHGCRAMAMTAIKEELGYRHEVIDRQLAHAPTNKNDKAYDRAAFLNDRKKMMQEWADYLDLVKENNRIISK